MRTPPDARVRLVVLNYDGGEDVLRCLDSLVGLDWEPGALEVVVVDNASSDGSTEAIEARFPQVSVVRNGTNGGFPANNLALGDLDGLDYVGLVNNDAYVDRGFLRPLVETLAASSTLGAACPKILLAGSWSCIEVDSPLGARLDEPAAIPGPGWVRPDDLLDPRPTAVSSPATLHLPAVDGHHVGAIVGVRTDGGVVDGRVLGSPVSLVNNVGNELTADWFGRDRGLHEPDAGQYDVPDEVFAWCGAAVLFPVRYLQDIGLFDERLFLYYEDLDLAWRGRRRGWRYRTAPAAVAHHRHGASSTVGSPLFRYHVERNRLVVLAKNAPARAVCLAAARYLLATASYARRDIVGPLLGGRRPAVALTWLRLRSFAGFVRLLPHALGERRRTR